MSPFASRWPSWIGLIALIAYGFFLQHNSAMVAGGSDSSGYLNSARLLSAGKLLVDLRAPAEFGPRAALDHMHFLPQGFFPYTAGGQLTPTYPTGLPLHFALAAKLFGWRAGPSIVALIAALAAVMLMYALARERGLDRGLAMAGAVVLAACPVFIFTSIQPLSDTLATTWTLAALLTAFRARKNVAWALAGGFALGVAVLVRPTNLLLAPALLVLLGGNLKKLALFVVGGLPCAAWLGFYNHHLYGSAWQSGYGGDVFSSFGISFGAPTAVHFVKWLALLLPAVVLVLAGLAWTRRATRTRELTGLTLAFAAIVTVYAFYEVSHETWWCLRFILPAIAALILTGLIGVEALATQLTAALAARLRTASATLLVVWAAMLLVFWAPRLDLYQIKHYERAYETGALAARAQLPKDALLLSFAFSGSLYFYTDFPVLRWDQIEAPVFLRYAELAQKAGRPVCAVLFDWEEENAFKRCPGDWKRIATLRNVGLWQLAAPKP